MKILLTIEEYKERVVNNLVEIGKQSFSNNINDFIAFTTLHKLAEESYTYHLAYKDSSNQLFLGVFGVDRNGNNIKDTMFDITQEECDEFNSQPCMKKFYEDCKKRWNGYYELRPFDKNYIHPIYKVGCTTFDVFKVIIQPFEGDVNLPYYAAKEAFERLFGYKYEFDNIKPILTKELIPS